MKTYYFDDEGPHDDWQEFQVEDDEKAIAYGNARRNINKSSIVYACDGPEGNRFRTIKEWQKGEPK